MSAGKNIKKYRKALGWSQSDLAREVGVTPQSVQQWEDDDTAPSRKNQEKVATALKVTKSQIMFGDEYEAKDLPTLTDDPEFIALAKRIERLSKNKRKAALNSVHEIIGVYEK